MCAKYACYESNAYPNIILHDCKINKIAISKDIVFSFLDGFWIHKHSGNLKLSGNAAVSIDLCANNVRCTLSRGYRILGKHYIIGHEIGLDEIAIMLGKGTSIEVIDEFYTFNQLYWRCGVNYSKKTRFTDEIVIKADGITSIEYRWDE